jgi:hypothetical protein
MAINLTLRNTKGSPLTFTELDNNFTALRQEFTDLAAVNSTVDIGGVPAGVIATRVSDPTLLALSGLGVTNNKGIFATGPDAFSTFDLTPFGRAFSGAADASAARNLLQLSPDGAGALLKATLSLDFTRNRLRVYEAFGLTDRILTDAITTSRATTATYDSPTGIVSAAANTPRITYDAATGNALGLLCEEQRTNLALWSEDLSNAVWSKANVTVSANSILAPVGSVTADKIVEDTATGSHEVSQPISLTVGVVNAISVYAKAGERSRVRLAGRQATNWSVLPSGIFDLLTGTVVSSTGAQNAEITAVGNGWYRCTIFGSPSSAGVGMIVGLVQSGTTISYTGNGTSGLHVWGSQLEVGPAPTSYIPTTTAQVTRVADVISRALTTTNANAGSIFIEFDLTSYSKVGNTPIVSLNAATQSSERGFALTIENNSIQAWIRSASSVSDASITVADSLQPMKALVSFDNVGLKILVSVNGAVSERSMASAIDISSFVSNIYISGGLRISGSAGVHSKTVKHCAYIPRALTAAEAQALTS